MRIPGAWRWFHPLPPRSPCQATFWPWSWWPWLSQKGMKYWPSLFCQHCTVLMHTKLLSLQVVAQQDALRMESMWTTCQTSQIRARQPYYLTITCLNIPGAWRWFHPLPPSWSPCQATFWPWWLSPWQGSKQQLPLPIIINLSVLWIVNHLFFMLQYNNCKLLIGSEMDLIYTIVCRTNSAVQPWDTADTVWRRVTRLHSTCISIKTAFWKGMISSMCHLNGGLVLLTTVRVR